MVKGYKKVLLLLLLFYVVLVMFAYSKFGINHIDSYNLDKYITADLYKSNGDVYSYDSNEFSVLNKNDRIVIHIHIPQEYKMKNAAIAFNVYNTAFTVSFKDKELYRFGYDIAERGRHIGAIYRTVNIPDEAFGSEVTLTCDVKENNESNHIKGVTLLPASDASKAVLIDHIGIFFVFVPLFVFAVIMLFISLTGELKNVNTRITIWFSLFAAIVSCYIISYFGINNIFIDNVLIASNIEYISLFFVAVPLIAYYIEIVHEKWIKRLLLVTDVLFLLFGIICTILNYTTEEYHYIRFILPVQVLMMIELVILIFVSIYEKNRTYDTAKIAPYGMILFFVIIFLEVLRYNADKYLNIKIPLLGISLVPMGVILFIAALLLNNISMIMSSYEASRENEQLKELAYTDSLTGLFNRMRCEKFIRELRQNKDEEYTVIFLDINNLKYVNDNYGHAAGDTYLKTVSSLISDYFCKADICGRYGGDEFFIAYKGRVKIYFESVLERINSDLENIRSEKNIPYMMSVSGGKVVSTKNNVINIDEAIYLADMKMYDYKRKYKESFKL